MTDNNILELKMPQTTEEFARMIEQIEVLIQEKQQEAYFEGAHDGQKEGYTRGWNDAIEQIHDEMADREQNR